jgi:hypothetical protein
MTLADLVFYSLVASFVLVAILMGVSRILHAKVERRSLAKRVICRLCMHAFEPPSHVGTVNCPVCRAVNETCSKRG